MEVEIDGIISKVPNLILIDGPRGSGKSTLAALLAAHLTSNEIPVTLMKKGPSAQSRELTNIKQHLSLFQATTDRLGGVVICDRFHASELVMSAFTGRRDMRAVIADVLEAERLVQEAGCLHIITIAPISVLAQRISERAQADQDAGREVRGWDVHPDCVWPLWMTAYGMLPSAVLRHNENEAKQVAIINQVSAVYGIKKITTTFELQLTGKLPQPEVLGVFA